MQTSFNSIRPQRLDDETSRLYQLAPRQVTALQLPLVVCPREAI